VFAITIPCGYLFYWGNLLVVQGRRTIGPHYYLGMLVPLTILGASGVVALLRRWRPIGTAVLVLLLVTASLSLYPRIRLDYRQAAIHSREQGLVDRAHLRNAIVFVPSDAPDGAWLLHPRAPYMNDPQLRQSVLFATDHAGTNFDLVDRYGARSLYRELSRIPPGATAGRPVPTLWRLHPQSAAAFHFHVHLVNTDGQPVITAYLGDGARLYRYALDHSSARGRSYDVDWTISPQGVTVDGAGASPGADSDVAAAALEVNSARALLPGTLVLGAESGPSAERSSANLVEERYWLRSRPGGLDLMLPGEQWRYEAGPRPRWLGQDTKGLNVDHRPL
jgi:hypothetical protein